MTTVKQALRAIEILEKSGRLSNPQLKEFVEAQDRKERGVKQVWGCKRCNHRLEMFVPAQNANHQCTASKSKESLLLTLLWKSP